MFDGPAAVFKKRNHPRLPGARLYDVSSRPAGNGLPEGIVDGEYFKNGHAAIKAVITAIAAGGLPAWKRPGPY